MVEQLVIIEDAVPLPLIAGAVLLLFGWILYRTVLAVAGGVLGAAIGYGIARLASGLFLEDGTAEVIAQGAGAVIGLIGGILIFHWMHRAAFFILGGVFGGWMFAEVFFVLRRSGMLDHGELVFAIGVAVSALVFALLFVIWNKYLIALVSAGAGTFLILGGADWPYEPLIGLPLFLVGFILQLKLSSLSRRNSEEDDE